MSHPNKVEKRARARMEKLMRLRAQLPYRCSYGPLITAIHDAFGYVLEHGDDATTTGLIGELFGLSEELVEHLAAAQEAQRLAAQTESEAS